MVERKKGKEESERREREDKAEMQGREERGKENWEKQGQQRERETVIIKERKGGIKGSRREKREKGGTCISGPGENSPCSGRERRAQNASLRGQRRHTLPPA